MHVFYVLSFGYSTSEEVLQFLWEGEELSDRVCKSEQCDILVEVVSLRLVSLRLLLQNMQTGYSKHFAKIHLEVHPGAANELAKAQHRILDFPVKVSTHGALMGHSWGAGKVSHLHTSLFHRSRFKMCHKCKRLISHKIMKKQK